MCKWLKNVLIAYEGDHFHICTFSHLHINKAFSHLLFFFQIAVNFDASFAATGGCGDSLAVVRVGYVAGSVNAGNACAGRVAFGDNVTCLIGLDPRLEEVAVGLVANG